MAKELSNNNVTYFKVDSDGFIYLRSDRPQEGYKEYHDRDGNSVGFKKQFSATDDGKISFLGIHTAKFDTGEVEYISISIEQNGQSENIQFPLLTIRKTLSPYAKAIAQILPNVDFSKTFSLSFDKRKDERGYTIKNMYLNQTEEDKNPSVPIFHKFQNKEGNNGGDIPNMVQKKGLGGKVEWDTSEQDNYLYESLREQIERFKSFKEGNVETQEVEEEVKEKPVKKEAETKATSNKQVFEEDEDSLPF